MPTDLRYHLQIVDAPDPADGVEQDDPRLAPWVGASKATPAEMEEAIRRILGVRNPRLRSSLEAEMFRMATSREILESTWLGQQLLEEGERNGIGKGLVQGESSGLRSALKMLIESRAPGMRHPAWLDRVADARRLNQIFRDVLAAPDQRAIRAALSKNRPAR